MHDFRFRRDGASRYPGYNVLSKSAGPSWNEQTRRVITRRLSIGAEPRFFTEPEFRSVAVIAARIAPQPASRPPVPVASLVDERLHNGASDGYRGAGMPRERDAWRQGLKALDAEARSAYGKLFADLAEGLQDHLLSRMQDGELNSAEWGDMRPRDFFTKRMARDIVLAYYSHPVAWSEIGWGGPASPRGYVRLDYDERDPWEAAEMHGGDIGRVRRINRDVS
jgi:hypothetical protein